MVSVESEEHFCWGRIHDLTNFSLAPALAGQTSHAVSGPMPGSTSEPSRMVRAI